ncbi:hypothetical protein [uncultured Flavobacterium sp.]|uniref:hypothetical protein n=1 Tax=uncultured Flavobacterium sp. TaxID=165435 RepID=UPI0025F8FA87|nr:hypothetical protein [uncultured Flavobacterium sp.]
MNQYYILKPKNLNVEKLVEHYKPDFKFNLDYAYLIVYLVILRGDKKNNKKQVFLGSKFLERLIGRNYHKYMDFLLENYPATGNVLNGYRYKKGSYPFSYKLTKYYFEGGVELYIIKDGRLINKLKGLFVKPLNENIRINYYFLSKYFKCNKLNVFAPFEAIDKTNSLASQKKRLKSAISLIGFLNGQHRLTLKTSTDGRVHSNFTRLSKQCRKYLKYEDEFLAEVDISSAVPYFLFIAMNSYINNNLISLKKFQYNNNSHSFAYIFDEFSGVLDNSEVGQFGKLILDGIIYDKFAELIFNKSLYESQGFDYDKVERYYQYNFKKIFGYYFDSDKADLKKFAKKRMLAMLFAKTSLYKFEQLAFKQLFPTVLNFVNEFKDFQRYRHTEEIIWTKKGRHKKMSYFCFQFEAKVMIGEIARQFDKLHKGKVPIFTLHDCLLTTVGHIEDLEEFMVKKFVELLGIAPNLTVERSSLENDYYLAG